MLITHTTSCRRTLHAPDLEDELADLGPEAGAGGDNEEREERRRRYEEDDFGDEGR